MAEETTTTTETPPAVIDVDELKDTVGDEVDARMEARGLTTDRLAKLDILDSLTGSIEELFGKHSTGSGVDKEGLLKEIGSLIDSKLAALNTGGGNTGGTSTEIKRGPLGRFLFGGSN